MTRRIPGGSHAGLPTVSLAAAVLFPLILFTSGCLGPAKRTADEAYQVVRQTDTITQYEQFLTDYPSSEHTLSAQERLKALRAERAEANRMADEKTLAKLRSYAVGITGFPEVARDFGIGLSLSGRDNPIHNQASPGIIKVLHHWTHSESTVSKNEVERDPWISMEHNANAVAVFGFRSDGVGPTSYARNPSAFTVVCRLEFKDGTLVSRDFPRRDD